MASSLNPIETPGERELNVAALAADAYSAYPEIRAILRAPSTDFKALASLLSLMAGYNDFSGIAALWDYLNGAGRIPYRLDSKPGLLDCLNRFANAMLRRGDMPMAIALFERVLEYWPTNITANRTLASIDRLTSPQNALDRIAALRDSETFRSDLPIILLYLELLVATGQSALARAEAMQLQPRAGRGEFLLPLCNAEVSPADKLVMWNIYLKDQGLTPVVSTNGRFGIDHFGPSPQLKRISYGPLVSVLMTTFNSQDYVRTAIGSILSQSYPNWELWIVDDCSTDGTRDILAECAQRDARIQVLHQTANGGTYVAKNRALSMARGEFVICHDSDDWSHPEHLVNLVGQLAENSELVACQSRWVRATSEGQFSLKNWGRYAHINPASLMFRREPVLERAGYFDSVRTGADTEFRQRIGLIFGEPAVELQNTVTTVGRLHDASLTQTGAAAIDENGISLVRQVYTGSWLNWHVLNKNAPTQLYRSIDIPRREFAAPKAILPDTIPGPDVSPTPDIQDSLKRLPEVLASRYDLIVVTDLTTRHDDNASLLHYLHWLQTTGARLAVLDVGLRAPNENNWLRDELAKMKRVTPLRTLTSQRTNTLLVMTANQAQAEAAIPPGSVTADKVISTVPGGAEVVAGLSATPTPFESKVDLSAAGGRQTLRPVLSFYKFKKESAFAGVKGVVGVNLTDRTPDTAVLERLGALAAQHGLSLVLYVRKADLGAVKGVAHKVVDAGGGADQFYPYLASVMVHLDLRADRVFDYRDITTRAVLHRVPVAFAKPGEATIPRACIEGADLAEAFARIAPLTEEAAYRAHMKAVDGALSPRHGPKMLSQLADMRVVMND